MKYCRITAKLLGPLIIQKGRQSNAPETLSYLPGSTLSGAVAAKYLRYGGTPDSEAFRALFLENPVSFPNLLPVCDPAGPSRVLPLTAMTCKRFPGFLCENGHGVKDHLVISSIGRMLKRPPEEDFSLCAFNDQEESCASYAEQLSGYWNGDLDRPQTHTVDILYRRHTGIDRTTGTVAPTVFYTTQAIADFRRDGWGYDGATKTPDISQQYLSGDLYLDDGQYSLLRSLLEGAPIFCGADRGRGYGELEVTISEVKEPSFDLSQWDQGFHARYTRIAGTEPEKGIYFSLKLESHAVFVDNFLRPTFEVSFPCPGVEQVVKIAQGRVLRGWQALWRLPKPDDVALSMGSVFLFRYTGDDREGLEHSLQQIIREGIGLRREEGCGRVSVCDPFHLTEVI